MKESVTKRTVPIDTKGVDMSKRIFSIILVFVLVFEVNIVPVGAVEIYTSESIEGTSDSFEFYSETAELISKYWDEGYYDTLFYSYEDGACKVDDEWYLPVKSFCKDTGISYKKSGKSFTMSSSEFTWECKINKTSSTFNGEKYVFENKPLKRNGVYVMNAAEIDEHSCFEIEESDEGISVSSPYQLKRLIVETKNGRKIKPKQYGAIDYVVNGNTYILQFETEADTKEAYEKLDGAKKISYVEPDRVISTIQPDSIRKIYDTYNSYGYDPDWNIEMLGSDKLAARFKETGIDRSAVVAVVDTGIDYNHEFLAGKIVSKGYDFINNDYDAYDDNGHGTHVAGIIVNTVSGADVSLLPVKVLSGQGYGSSLAVYNGILYAAESGADVINLSLGGASYGTGHYEDTAIQKAISMGSIVVVAAGNSESDTAYECPAHNYDAIVVSAIDSNYERAYFSNYGSSVDFAAPGVNIWSSVPDNEYVYWSGTSMATPHISGLAALLKILVPNMTCSEAASTLKSMSVDLGAPGFDVYYGYGVPYVGDMEFNGYGNWELEPTPTQNVTSTPTATPAPGHGVTSAPKPTETITGFPDWPTWVPIVTAYPTAAPIITSYPTITPIITVTPKPSPVITQVPTMTPVITVPPVITQPPYYGDTSCSISTSSSSVNGRSTMNISIKTGSGVKNVVISVSNGTKYEYNNNGNGINETLRVSGSGLSFDIKAYDHYGNTVYSGNVSC